MVSAPKPIVNASKTADRRIVSRCARLRRRLTRTAARKLTISQRNASTLIRKGFSIAEFLYTPHYTAFLRAPPSACEIRPSSGEFALPGEPSRNAPSGPSGARRDGNPDERLTTTTYQG